MNVKQGIIVNIKTMNYMPAKKVSIYLRGNTREKGGNPEKCVRGFPVLHSEADPGGTSRKTVFLERELGNGRQAAGLRSSRLDRAPRSGWLSGKPVFRLGQAGRNGQLNAWKDFGLSGVFRHARCSKRTKRAVN